MYTEVDERSSNPVKHPSSIKRKKSGEKSNKKTGAGQNGQKTAGRMKSHASLAGSQSLGNVTFNNNKSSVHTIN